MPKQSTSNAMNTESNSTTDTDVTADEPHVWVEKYRPETLDEVVGQNDITTQLAGYVENKELPNLLFSGQAGTGKTTSAVAMAKEIYGDEWEDHFLELNASDDRGIDVVRERIKNFARTSFTDRYSHRIIFLDEADSLTGEAQSALRRTMEQFSHNIRFILSVNYSSKIIDPIQSRCSVFRFTPVDETAMMTRLQSIADTEDIPITQDGLDAIVYTANGDMRRAVNTLQATSLQDRTVDEETVFSITSTPHPEEIEEMVQLALQRDYRESREQLQELLTERGLSAGDILTQIHRLVWDFDVTDEQAVNIMDRVGEADYRITEGADGRIQLESLLANLAQSA